MQLPVPAAEFCSTPRFARRLLAAAAEYTLGDCTDLLLRLHLGPPHSSERWPLSSTAQRTPGIKVKHATGMGGT